MPQLTRPRLLKQDEPEPSRADIEMARISQSWREWNGINGKPWQPVKDDVRNPLDVDTVRGYLIIKTDAPISWFKWLLRRLRTGV